MTGTLPGESAFTVTLLAAMMPMFWTVSTTVRNCRPAVTVVGLMAMASTCRSG